MWPWDYVGQGATKSFFWGRSLWHTFILNLKHSGRRTERKSSCFTPRGGCWTCICGLTGCAMTGAWCAGVFSCDFRRPNPFHIQNARASGLIWGICLSFVPMREHLKGLYSDREDVFGCNCIADGKLICFLYDTWGKSSWASVVIWGKSSGRIAKEHHVALSLNGSDHVRKEKEDKERCNNFFTASLSLLQILTWRGTASDVQLRTGGATERSDRKYITNSAAHWESTTRAYRNRFAASGAFMALTLVTDFTVFWLVLSTYFLISLFCSRLSCI